MMCETMQFGDTKRVIVIQRDRIDTLAKHNSVRDFRTMIFYWFAFGECVVIFENLFCDN